jgi:hypothetical protein
MNFTFFNKLHLSFFLHIVCNKMEMIYLAMVFFCFFFVFFSFFHFSWVGLLITNNCHKDL